VPGQGAFAGLDLLLADIVRGDLAMREQSLLAAGESLPTLLVATGVQAELSYQAQSGDTRRLAWLARASEQPVADVRLSLRLRPSLGSPRRPAPARLELAAPVFLAAVPPASDRLSLSFGPGPLVIGLPGDRRLILPGGPSDLKVALPSRAGEEPESFSGDYLSAWPIPALVATLDGIADWRRSGEPRQIMAFTIPANPLLGGLLSKVTGVYGEVAEILDGDPPDPDGRLAALRSRLERYSPLLTGVMTLEEIGARIKLYVDDYGELARRSDNLYRQRLDLDVEQVGTALEPALRFTLRMEDFLVGGDLHARFLAALRTPESIKELWSLYKSFFHSPFPDAPSEPPRFKKEEITAYLLEARHDSSAVIVRMRHDDTDLVLLRGTVGGDPLEFLYQVTFTAGGIRRPLMLAIREGDKPWEPGTVQNIAPRFFYRLYQTLYAWQGGIAGGASS
jgi:hypothetical protein